MLAKLRAVQGDVGFYYKNLVTGNTLTFEQEKPLVAASVIKLPMMIEAFRQFEAGTLDENEPVTIRAVDRVPSCGVLTYLHDGLTVTMRDIVTLSIIVSDNTATNLLMDRIGIDSVNQTLLALGAVKTRLRRKMFNWESASRGIQNMVTAGEMGMLLEMLYLGKVVSPAASAEMLAILKNQQLGGKMPFRIKGDIAIAHKTGEDSGVTHDVGIVFAPEPFVACFLSNNVDTPAFNRLIQEMTWELAYAQ